MNSCSNLEVDRNIEFERVECRVVGGPPDAKCDVDLGVGSMEEEVANVVFKNFNPVIMLCNN